jgi:hypothetical protein
MALSVAGSDNELEKAEQQVMESMINIPKESRKNIMRLLNENATLDHLTPNSRKRKTHGSPTLPATPQGFAIESTRPCQTAPTAQPLSTPGKWKNRSQYKTDVVYIHNNIPSSIENPIKRAEDLTACMPENVQITDTKIKQTGQIILFPATPEDYNRLLKKKPVKRRKVRCNFFRDRPIPVRPVPNRPIFARPIPT